MKTIKYVLPESAMPTAWYNIAADLPSLTPPMLRPDNHLPVTPADLAPLFPDELIAQEFSVNRWHSIPGPVLDILRQWRPSPLFRARRLEAALDTPARIYYKYEGTSPTGSHKLNTAVAQAYYNKQAGTRRVTTETGAGQWGSAMALACSLFDLRCDVFWVRLSHDQKPYRKTLMELFGANVIASPSDQTAAGRAILKDEPDSPGSLGIAISEAVEAAVQSGGHTKYALGSVLNHVLQQQTVIGQEAIMQMELADDYPDVVIGCTGGGSNFAGLAFPFVSEVLAGVRATEFVAVEPEVCASLSEGLYTYDYGDTAATTPLLKMHTLGHDFRPPSHHAGGLRYHGMAPQVSQLVDAGLVQVRAESQSRCFDAAAQFARAEAIVPAPESSHAIRVAIDEALAARATGHDKVILFNLSGHGHFDMGAYRAYLAGSLEDPEAVVAG